MGSVHKFPRPPKNRQQFKGYRPSPGPGGSSNGGGGDKPGRVRLRDWHRTVLAWATVLGLAVVLWAIGRLL